MLTKAEKLSLLHQYAKRISEKYLPGSQALDEVLFKLALLKARILRGVE